MFKRPFGGLVIVLIAATALVGQHYYAWATSAETPFDEVGIRLHRHMPAFGSGLELR